MNDVKEREFHCFFAESELSRAAKREWLKPFFRYFEECKAIADLGSGDGVFLEALKTRYPDKRIAGVDLNDELLALAKKNAPGVEFVRDDILSFVRREYASYDGYLLSDLIEHLDFTVTMELLMLFSRGSTILIKTPNTDSLLGHQFYLQVPSHKAPYSPTVLKRMLERTGFVPVAEGECDGILYPGTLLGRIRRGILRLLFIDEYKRIFGGGNYYIIARKG